VPRAGTRTAGPPGGSTCARWPQQPHRTHRLGPPRRGEAQHGPTIHREARYEYPPGRTSARCHDVGAAWCSAGQPRVVQCRHDGTRGRANPHHGRPGARALRRPAAARAASARAQGRCSQTRCCERRAPPGPGADRTSTRTDTPAAAAVDEHQPAATASLAAATDEPGVGEGLRARPRAEAALLTAGSPAWSARRSDPAPSLQCQGRARRQACAGWPAAEPGWRPLAPPCRGLAVKTVAPRPTSPRTARRVPRG
jgi:hypothetical protein